MATAQLYHRSPAVTPICLKSYTSPIAIHSWLKLERILTGLPISRSAIPGHFRKTARNWDTRMPHHPGLPLATHDKNLNTQKKRSTDILKTSTTHPDPQAPYLRCNARKPCSAAKALHMLERLGSRRRS